MFQAYPPTAAQSIEYYCAFLFLFFAARQQLRSNVIYHFETSISTILNGFIFGHDDSFRVRVRSRGADTNKNSNKTPRRRRREYVCTFGAHNLDIMKRPSKEPGITRFIPTKHSIRLAVRVDPCFRTFLTLFRPLRELSTGHTDRVHFRPFFFLFFAYVFS